MSYTIVSDTFSTISTYHKLSTNLSPDIIDQQLVGCHRHADISSGDRNRQYRHEDGHTHPLESHIIIVFVAIIPRFFIRREAGQNRISIIVVILQMQCIRSFHRRRGSTNTTESIASANLCYEERNRCEFSPHVIISCAVPLSV